MSLARISHAYDPLNGITLDAITRAYKSYERTMAFDHILEIPHSNHAEDLYLFDCGYPSITLIFSLLSKEFCYEMQHGLADHHKSSAQSTSIS